MRRTSFPPLIAFLPRWLSVDDMSEQQTQTQRRTQADGSRPTVRAPSVQTMIRPARELAGISLRELAKRVGVSVGTMSAIETGKSTASPERLELIVEQLGTTVELLLRSDHEPAAERPIFDWRDYPDANLDPVLDAAIICFVETGYHGATMRTIAAQAQISVPGVYHHYASKQSLLVAGFDLAIAELMAHVRPARDDGETPVARLSNICEAIVLFATMRRDLARIVVNEARNVDAPDSSRVQKFTDDLIAQVRAEIDAGISGGALSTDDPAAAARAALALSLSVCQWDSTDVEPTKVARQYSRFAVNLVR